jgi:hypothetical protein
MLRGSDEVSGSVFRFISQKENSDLYDCNDSNHLTQFLRSIFISSYLRYGIHLYVQLNKEIFLSEVARLNPIYRLIVYQFDLQQSSCQSISSIFNDDFHLLYWRYYFQTVSLHVISKIRFAALPKIGSDILPVSLRVCF